MRNKDFLRQKHLLARNILSFGELRNSRMCRLSFRRVLLLSLCVLLVGVPMAGSVEADGAVYIRADGSVVVEKDDVVVDGAGFGLRGTGIGAGVNLTGRVGVVVRNMEVADFLQGHSLKAPQPRFGLFFANLLSQFDAFFKLGQRFGRRPTIQIGFAQVNQSPDNGRRVISFSRFLQNVCRLFNHRGWIG